MDLFAENGPCPKRRLYEEKMVKRLGDFHFDTETASNAVITDVTDDRDDWGLDMDEPAPVVEEPSTSDEVNGIVLSDELKEYIEECKRPLGIFKPTRTGKELIPYQPRPQPPLRSSESAPELNGTPVEDLPLDRRIRDVTDEALTLFDLDEECLPEEQQFSVSYPGSTSSSKSSGSVQDVSWFPETHLSSESRPALEPLGDDSEMEIG
ncbi:hypothetical protein AAVH_15210 [Aphelenchoides avenae]|nr:hypothetical protein AAVH_15210 [Aphelenchus avenae]